MVKMRYIGGKTKILPYLEGFLSSKISLDASCSLVFLDLFGGTGVVGRHFKKNFKVITNDNMYFSYILSKGSVITNKPPKFLGLKDNGIKEPLEYLNNISGVEGFITQNYASELGEGRMYFTQVNAMKIDAIRQEINKWLANDWINQNEFDYLLATLIEAVPFISNTTGTYGAYLKHWDKRALKNLSLIHPILYDNNQDNSAFNKTAEILTKDIMIDVCYIDPPYNGRQYTSNYHILETIAKYDSPNIKGVTGIRDFDDGQASNFCKKRMVFEAFEQVIEQVDCKHLIISYSSDGLLSKEQITDLLLKHGIPETFDFKPINYETYKSKIVLKPKVNEYLFYIRKADK